MKRRRFALFLAATIAAPGLRAQRKTPRIGVLTTTALTPQYRQALLQGLRGHGYTEGRNILIEWRAAEDSTDRADALAAELVALPVDLIVASLTPAVRAARRASATTPIVMAFHGAPVELGLVKSLAHPGGNVTGLTNSSAELSGKRLAQLRQLLPQLSKIALLVNRGDPFSKPFVEESREPARRLGLELEVVDGAAVSDFQPVFAELRKRGVGAVVVQGSLLGRAHQIAQSALHHKLPTLSPQKQFVHAGGLMSYGADELELVRRSASYVDRILKGARPAQLPVEQPTKFEFTLNLKTAARLGLNLSESALVQADEVIR